MQTERRKRRIDTGNSLNGSIEAVGKKLKQNKRRESLKESTGSFSGLLSNSNIMGIKVDVKLK